MSENFKEPIVIAAEDLEPVVVPVRIGTESFFLVEPDESVAIRYKNYLLSCTKMVDGKVVGMEGVGEGDSLIVSLCLYKANKEGNLQYDSNNRPDKRTLVSIHTVRGWKPRLVKQLSERLKAIGDISEQDETVEFLETRIKNDTEKLEKLRQTSSNSLQEERAKNGQGSTPHTTAMPANAG